MVYVDDDWMLNDDSLWKISCRMELEYYTFFYSNYLWKPTFTKFRLIDNKKKELRRSIFWWCLFDCCWKISERTFEPISSREDVSEWNSENHCTKDQRCIIHIGYCHWMFCWKNEQNDDNYHPYDANDIDICRESIKMKWTMREWDGWKDFTEQR